MTLLFGRPKGWRKIAALLGIGVFMLAGESRAQPPSITRQPLPLTIGPGDRAGFAVTAEGEAPLRFQWYRNGVALSGATDDFVVIPAATGTDAGDYTVMVQNLRGTETSATAKLAVETHRTEWVDWAVKEAGQTDVVWVQPDGRSFVQYYGQLKRLNSDGSVDPGFSFALPTNLTTVAVKMERRSDGRYLALVTTGLSIHASPISYSSALYALKEDGSQDATFVPPSDVSTKLGSRVLIPVGNEVIVAIDGKLVRLKSDGALDEAFVSSVMSAPGGETIPATRAALDEHGGIWVAGGRDLWRLTADGSRDASTPLIDLGAPVVEIAAGASGPCWVSTTEPDASNRYGVIFHLRRFSATGQVDAGFAEFTQPGRSDLDFSVQPDGRVIVAGGFTLTIPGDEQGREEIHPGVVRLMGDGSIDRSFAPALAGDWWTRWWVAPDGVHAVAFGNSGVQRLNLSTSGAIEPPRILKLLPAKPENLAGNSMSMQVIAVGVRPIRYSQGDYSPFPSGGSATDSLVFSDAQAASQVWVVGPGGQAARTLTDQISPSAPRIMTPLAPVSAREGQITMLSAPLRGTEPMTIEWLKDGALVRGPWELGFYDGGVASFILEKATLADAGIYTLRVTNDVGVKEWSARVTVGPVSQLTNLSVRAVAGTGEKVMIVGFVLPQQKRVFFQAIGPELERYGVAGALADPVATLHFSTGGELTNDDGGTTGMPGYDPIYRETGAWPLVFSYTKSAELYPGTIDGVNSIVVTGKGDTTGVALAQIFDADGTTNRLVNLSARVFSGAGDTNAITGFIIKGDAPKKVLIRCVGPGLAGSGVAQPMLDPNLTLVDQATHAILATNHDWGTGAAMDVTELRRVMPLVGAFPLAEGSRDAALVATLPPGAYSAVVSGADGATGIVLLEVYDVP